MARRNIGRQHHRELTVRSLQRARSEAAFDARDVVDPNRAIQRRDRQPPDFRRVAPLVLEHANLDWILLLSFLVEGDSIVAGDGEAERVADRRHPHAEIRGAPAVDGDVDFWIRHAQAEFWFGQARHTLRGCEGFHRVVGQLRQIRPEDVRRNRVTALTLAAAQRVARCDARSVRGVPREPLADLGDDFALRLLALVDRKRLKVEMHVRHVAAAASAGSAAAARVDERFDLRDPVDAVEFLEHLERDFLRAFERGSFGRVHVDGPLAHVFVGHEVTAHHPVQREREQKRDDRHRDDDSGMIERPVHLARVPLIEPVEEPLLLGFVVGDGVRQLEDA